MRSKGSIIQLATTSNKLGTGTVTLDAEPDEFWAISRITVSGGSGALVVLYNGDTVLLDVDVPSDGVLDLDYHESVLHNDYQYNQSLVVSCAGAKINLRYR
jgi:hypothetical protein